MHDLLTPSVNVPAEREKLRQLRNEIAADVELRKEHHRRYTARGFLRDMQPLEAEGKPSDGRASVRPVCAGSAVVIPAADAELRETQAGCARCGRCSCGLGGEGVSA